MPALLSLLGYVIGFLLLCPLLRLAELLLKYQFQKHHYRDLWRHPRPMPRMSDYYNKTGLMGKAFALVKNSDGTLPKLANWGPYITGQSYIYVTDREAIRTILTSKSVSKSPIYLLYTEFTGNGLLTVPDERVWESERKLITPFFHQHSLKRLFDSMAKMAEKFMSEHVKKLDPSSFHPAKELFQLYTSSVITNLAFSDAVDGLQVAAWVKEATTTFRRHLLGRLLLGKFWSFIPYYGSAMLKVRAKMRALLTPTIKKRRAEKTQEAHVDLLSYISSVETEQGEQVDMALIVDECITFLFAGTDTAATGLSWLMYHLGQNPDVQFKIQQEVERVLKGRTPEYSDLANLTYCQCVIQEALRISPPVPLLDRQATEEIELAGVKLPKGTILGVGIWNLHHDPNLWKDPDTFIPERWLDGERLPYSWIPFSAGPRNCIGGKFAEHVMLFGVAKIFQDYTIEFNKEKEVIPILDGVLSPHNLDVKFVPRSKPNV